MKALLDILDDVNQTLSIVKAQHGLKNKVAAISLVVNTHKEEHMELLYDLNLWKEYERQNLFETFLSNQ